MNGMTSPWKRRSRSKRPRPDRSKSSRCRWDPKRSMRPCASAWPRVRTARFASGRRASKDPIPTPSPVGAPTASLFAGVQSSDQAFASTGIATAAFLGWPHAAVVSSLGYTPGAKSAVFRRELEGGLLHEVEIQCPAVLTIQLGINTPRYASLRSIKQAAAKPIEVRSLADFGLSAGDVGEAGSLSRVRRMYVPDKGRAQLIEGDTAQQAKRLAEIIREFKGE